MCEQIFVCLVCSHWCSQLEGEMFLITNQLCLAATEEMVQLKASSYLMPVQTNWFTKVPDVRTCSVNTME